MESSFAELDSLVALITTAIEDVKAEYTKLNLPFPQLADVKSHPVDTIQVPRNLKRAVQVISGACAQLSALVLSPEETTFLLANNHLSSVAVRVVTESKIADILEDRPGGLHISELAVRVNIDGGKLGRILRFLASKHVFREVKKDVFANNRLSMRFVTKNPISALVGFNADEVYTGGGMLYETLTDPTAGPSSSPIHAPFARAHKHTLFEFYRAVDPARGKRFGIAMTSIARMVDTKTMIQSFPWTGLPAGSVVCDMGSSVGHISMDIARANPGVSIVLQDFANVLEQAQSFFHENAPDVLENDRVRFVPFDFLKDSPVAGCDYYYLKHIIHNWSDDNCRLILANIKKVMKPTSRIIIQEYVMQYACEDIDDTPGLAERAPAPLLPNYGTGRIIRYVLDVMMMAILNSCERTLPEFKLLSDPVGLDLVKVWDCGELSAVELKLRSD